MDGDSFTRIGKPAARIDGRAKVTGRALYASDEAASNPAYAYLVTSAIARGRVASMELDSREGAGRARHPDPLEHRP